MITWRKEGRVAGVVGSMAMFEDRGCFMHFGESSWLVCKALTRRELAARLEKSCWLLGGLGHVEVGGELLCKEISIVYKYNGRLLLISQNVHKIVSSNLINDRVLMQEPPSWPGLCRTVDLKILVSYLLTFRYEAFTVKISILTSKLRVT